MDWIKKRYDQFLLILCSLLVAAVAIMLFLRVQSFPDTFSSAVAAVPQKNDVPKVKLDRLEAAKATMAKPNQWVEAAQNKDRGSLFVSERYIIDEQTGMPVTPENTSKYKDSMTGKDIPNKWLIDHNLPLFDSTVALQDPDKDGFTNEDEWRGTRDNTDPTVWHDSTNPNDKNSHPPYYTKLFLKQFVQVPFRLVFKSYDGTPGKDPIEKFSFQIDTIDLKQPTEFLTIGQMVPRTKFKLEKFAFKEAYDAALQDKKDVSELTLVNTETGDVIVLIYNQMINSPDVYAIFDYQWAQPAQDIRVKKLQDFALRPETDEQHRYKLIDINANEALIKLPSGETYKVVRDPRKPAK